MSVVPENLLQGGMDTQALMQQLAQDNPRLAALMQFMNSQQEEAQDQDQETVAETAPVDPRVRRLAHEVRALREENRLLIQQAEILADALGACHCFGADETCPECGGEGEPGTYLPNRDRFEQLVMPVLLNLKAWREQRRTQRHTRGQVMSAGADDLATGHANSDGENTTGQTLDATGN